MKQASEKSSKNRSDNQLKRKIPAARGVRKPTGENLIVARDEFSTLILAVFVVSAIEWHRQTRPHPELKTRPRFCPVTLNLSMCCMDTITSALMS
jgi:hypothetical protein